MTGFKPLLGKDIDFGLAKWPLSMSPKLDGIRCMIIDGVAMSRSLIPIPNEHVQRVLGRALLNGLDGELIVGAPNAPDVYLRTYSGVMKKTGEPEFTFHVFDDFTSPSERFTRRLAQAASRVLDTPPTFPLEIVVHDLIQTEADARLAYEHFLTMGFEGAMFRDPDGVYKFGRSTAKQCTLLKWKPLVEFDAEVIGYYEELHNGNEATVDALGHTKRSSHQDNKVGKGSLGGVRARCRETGAEFDCGIFKGVTKEELRKWWIERDTLVGRIFKCVKMGFGEKDRPRHPRWIGWRDVIDT